MNVDLGIELNTTKGGVGKGSKVTCLSIQHAGHTHCVFFDTDVNRQLIIKLVNTKWPYKRENPQKADPVLERKMQKKWRSTHRTHTRVYVR